jgi:tRNA(fMet)-specific endonuclease VapC
MGTLIDTSILVAVDRGALAPDALPEAFPDETWFISTITVSEILQGVFRTNSRTHRETRLAFAEEKIREFEIADFDLRAARTHAELWAELTRRGRMVGERDLMIAATALSRDFAVATRDLRSFPKIPGLRVLTL